MEVSGFGRRALTSCLIAAILAGCGGSQRPIGAPGTMTPAVSSTQQPTVRLGTSIGGLSHSSRETVVYAFRGGDDGAGPGGALFMDARGAIYGITGGGGYVACYHGCGTVFKLTPSGSAYKERILYKFTGGADGESPDGGLIMDGAGTLYGTTLGGSSGCPPGCGTIYALTPTKSGYVHNVLYSFKGGSDGYGSYGGLSIDSSGALYGTTAEGGAHNAGTAYKLTPTKSGYEKSTLFSFSPRHDAEPLASLLLGKRGVLYGTALFSSVFELTPKSSHYVVRTLHELSGPPDGSLPYANVITGPGGAFYGTTYEGGTSHCKYHDGCGTAYELSPTKSGYGERVFSFANGDGAYPLTALLLAKDGALYGTTTGGGLKCPGREPTYGCGVAFKLGPAGSGFKETVLHKFTGGSDGDDPSSPLVADASGALYGAAGAGGGGLRKCQGGCGIIFKLAP
ncbi:MAG TPA: choice-of-anchor tandem repeat GloVer-containing protein [Candidatus Cybelea sp.]|nr:choice-of-anchor tandem repeat GloVer-containing protein [Candidatus Cybelea sp.]